MLFHGLNGHHETTWTCPGEQGEFWPKWLLDDAPGVRITSVEYDASPSKWLSHAMPIADRAANIANLLVASGTYLNAPLALVGHSLGGNIIKALIRHLYDHRSTDERYERLLGNIRLVLFLGTPHSGSRVQRLLPRFLRWAFRETDLIKELEAESSMLRDLAQWYRSNMPKAAKHVVLVEAKPTGNAIEIVSPSSSDPGLPNVVPIPVDASHMSICKPADRNSEVYKIILDNVETVLADSLSPLLQDPVSLGRSPVDRTQRRRRGLSSRLGTHRKSLIDAAERRPFTILLCGPRADDGQQTPASELCAKIGALLAGDGFDVVYGQASGITNVRLGSNENALGRELDFIASQCNAVIVIASGASGWSELGLFGWHMASDKATREKGIDIVVLADDAEVDSAAFIGSGPIAYSEAVGRADVVSIPSYDPETILQRMRARRSMYVMDRRGRPKKTAA
ncbi:MAG TPA: hypothetical protein VF552_05360 [Allosphingosinicella sp.]|jgi:hypothetical protein